MSTVYRVRLRSPAGAAVDIEIERNLIPLPLEDSWTTESPEALATPGGKVFAWGDNYLQLASKHGPASIMLEGLRKSTVAGDNGHGMKAYPDGNMPMGDLDWACLSVD